MIDNPLKWVDEFKDYIKEPQEFSYGDFCLITDTAPAKAKADYAKYINLISHVLLTWDCIVKERNKIIKCDPSKAQSNKEKEQIRIVEKLIKSGTIKYTAK